MYGFIEKTSDLKEENAIYNEVVEAGKGWMHELLPGQSLRIVDMEGNQAVDTTFYDMTNPEDHYGAIPTIVMQKNIYLTTGTILRTESGKPLLEITADLTGRKRKNLHAQLQRQLHVTACRRYAWFHET